MENKDNKKNGFSIFADFVGNVAARSTNLVVEKSKQVLKDKMKEGFKALFLKSVIKFVIIFLGIFLVILKPFGYFASHLIASLLFIGVLVWSLISIIKVIKNYYRLVYFVIKDKSIKNGTWDFISYKWPSVAKGISGYNAIRNIGAVFSSNFEKMPEVDNTVKDFLRYILKDVIIFFSFFFLYLFTVNFVVKPFLIRSVAGLSTLDLYIFPVLQIKNFIVYIFS